MNWILTLIVLCLVLFTIGLFLIFKKLEYVYTLFQSEEVACRHRKMQMSDLLDKQKLACKKRYNNNRDRFYDLKIKYKLLEKRQDAFEKMVVEKLNKNKKR